MSEELYKAAEAGNLEDVNKALKVPGVDVNYLGGKSSKFTALLRATIRKRTATVARLLKEPKINVDLAPNGDTPLMIAVSDTNLELTNLLLPVSDLSLRNTNNDTAFDIAMRNVDLAKTLEERKLCQTILNLLPTPTMLCAAEHNDLPLLNKMLICDANPNATNPKGLSALMLLLQPQPIPTDRKALPKYHQNNAERLQTAAALINKGANPNRAYPDGTPVLLALLKHHSNNLENCLLVLKALVATNKMVVIMPCTIPKVVVTDGVRTIVNTYGTILDVIKDMPAAIKALIEPLYAQQTAAQRRPQQPAVSTAATTPYTPHEFVQGGAFLMQHANTRQDAQVVSNMVDRRTQQTFFQAPATANAALPPPLVTVQPRAQVPVAGGQRLFPAAAPAVNQLPPRFNPNGQAPLVKTR